MASKIVSLLVLGCFFYASAHHRAEQYTIGGSAHNEEEQCIPEQVLKDEHQKWCDKKPSYDPNVLKEMYTEDATFQYMDKPEMKIQESIEMMASFMKEFKNFYNITKCEDFAGTYEFLGCEHNTIPAVLKGVMSFKGKDIKHSLNGPYFMEFKYENGELKVSKFVTKVAIEPSIFKKIWGKVVKSLEGTVAPELLETTTDSNPEEEEEDSQIYDAKNEKEQCIPEKKLKDLMGMFCAMLPEKFDSRIVKRIYAKDATFQYNGKPVMKVQDNIQKMLAFKREFDAYFKITTCEDYHGITKYIGCESNKFPSVITSTIDIKGMDKEHSLQGKCLTEFIYEDGIIKISKNQGTLAIEPSVFEQIWQKVQNELEEGQETSTESTDNNEEVEYDD